MTTVLFWDIDGTLINSGGAGRLALAEAAIQMIGDSVDLSSMKMAGLTELEIALNILERIGVSPDEHNLKTFLSLYEKNIAACLHQTEGYIIAGVPEILETLKHCEQVISILLTGNCAAGAWAKLSHYGLNHYFRLGAFGEKYAIAPTWLNLP
jgi:phosphoglycolate phosphatase